MIFKVYYQLTKDRNPKREQTHSLYVESTDIVAARTLVEAHTPYNVEFIQPLEGNHLAYEKEHADFKIASFE